MEIQTHMLLLWLRSQTFGTSTVAAPVAEYITGLARDPGTHGRRLLQLNTALLTGGLDRDRLSRMQADHGTKNVFLLHHYRQHMNQLHYH